MSDPNSPEYAYDPMASGTSKRWGSRGETKSGAPEIPGYDLRDNIGSGGMGSVWTAIYKPLNQARAVKILDKALARDESFRERFSEEAKAMGRLEHPNIVKVYDANAEFDPPYIAMEWIEGKTFTQILNSRSLPHSEAVGYFEQLAAALDYAHGQGFIHRDIKPANVLITPNGRAYLIDFGIASWLGADSQGNTTLTGTTSYLAPELIQGRLPSFSSDIWAFSVMVFRIISGGMPFEGGTPDQILKKIIAESPSDPKVMSPRLKAFLLKLLQKDPSLRYKSARALVADLKIAIDPLTVIGGAKGLGIGAGVVLGAVVLGIAFKGGGGAPAPKADAPKGTVASQPTKPTSGSNSKPAQMVPSGTKPAPGGPSSKAVVAALNEFKGVWYADLGTAFAEVSIEPTSGRGVSATWRVRDSKGAVDLALVGELAEDLQAVAVKDNSAQTTLGDFSGKINGEKTRILGATAKFDSVRLVRVDDIPMSPYQSTADFFSIMIPTSWTTSTETDAGGGRTTAFSPIGDPNIQLRITVRPDDGSVPLLTQLEKKDGELQTTGTYTRLNVQGDTTVAGRRGAALQYRLKTDAGFTQAETFLFQKGNQVYAVESYYPGQAEAVWAPVFKRVVSNLRFVD